MKFIRQVFLFLIMSVLLSPHIAYLQDCLAIVEAAAEATNSACIDTGRNQACYGNVRLEFEPQAGVENVVFEQQGDIADVTAIRSLSLSPLDDETDEWGVVLMRIQANLPDTLPGQNVTLLLFGDVQMTNAAPIRFDVTATGNINLRSTPSTDAAIADGLTAGESITASGRLEDGSWLRVDLPDGGTGWVFAELVSSENDLATLDIVDPADSALPYRPMQAFYFSSGIGDAPCVGAPESGILIQTPTGAGEIDLQVNEVNIRLGSTAFLQAQSSDTLRINLIENQANVAAFDTARTVIAGTRVQVPLDENLAASGPPGELEPFDLQTIQALPLGNLERQVTIPSPLSPDDIAVLPTPTNASPPAATFSDSSADVVTCDTQVSATDPEVDIVQTLIRQTANTLSIEVQLESPLVTDYSFAILLFLTTPSGYKLYIWEIHDGELRIGELDPNTGLPFPENEQQVSVEHNQEIGVVSFVFPQSSAPSFNQLGVSSFHTPSRETQPQPTNCDNSGPFEVNLDA